MTPATPHAEQHGERTETTSAVRVVRRGHLLVLTLDQPDKRNAVNLSMARQLADGIDLLNSDKQLRCAILHGAENTFCAGMDLTESEPPDIPGRGFGGLTQLPPTKPVIAAVEGYAVGGGLELALSCDLIVAARDARFGLPEVKRGLVAGGGGALRLPQRIGFARALRLALTGELVNATDAHSWGLVSDLTEPGQALTTAHHLAEAIAANAPLAVEATLALIRTHSALSNGLWALQSRLVSSVARSADAEEGVSAFLDRRQPHWTGS